MTPWIPTQSALLIRACAVLAACVCGLGLLSGEAQASCGDHLQTAREFRDHRRLAPESPAPVTRCNGPHCQQRPAVPVPQPRELPRVDLPRDQWIAAVGGRSDTSNEILFARRRSIATLQALPGFAETLERPPR